MKRLILALVFALAIVSWATTMQQDFSFRHTIAAADTGAQHNDSTFLYFRIHEKGVDPVLFYYRTCNFDFDTAFTGDTLRLVWHVGVSRNGPWQLFDTTKIALPATSRDTLVNVGARIDVDSTAFVAHSNWVRCKVRYEYDLVGNDTLLVGNNYDLAGQIWLNGRY